MFKVGRKFQTCVLLALSFSTSRSAFPGTLMEAFSEAYVYNTKLRNERAVVRIADEDVLIARSHFLPQIEGIGSYSRNRVRPGSYRDSGSVGIQLNQRLFNGFSTQNALFSTQAKGKAQREHLRDIEQGVFLDVVVAYTNVYRARRIADFRKENLAALEEQVRSHKAKLDVGEGARVDFAQAKAARALAVSELSFARANVKSEEAIYRRIVGSEPRKLERPSMAKNLPASLEAAYKISIMMHPAILYAGYLVEVSRYNLKAKEGAFLPKVDFSATVSYNRTYSEPREEGVLRSVGLSIRVPIFEAGRMPAQVRQAKEQLVQAQIGLESARDGVRQALDSAWSRLEGVRASVSAYRESVRAAEVAFEGRVQANHAGQGTVLDVLNSRSQLINAQIALITAECDAVIASYGIRSSIGKLTASDLGLKKTKYIR